MKIRFLMMALIGMGLEQASAQFFIGPRAGLNLANMSTDAAGTVNSMKIGIHGGLTSKWKFTKQLAVTGDALFSQQGTSSVLSVAGTDGKIVMETETATTFLSHGRFICILESLWWGLFWICTECEQYHHHHRLCCEPSRRDHFYGRHRVHQI